MKGIKCVIDNGNSGTIITAECHMANSLPNIVIVGFAHRSIEEARDRIRGALASCKVKLPPKRIIVNLSPADIPKEGSSFDLPILLSILITGQMVSGAPDDRTVVMGEIGLDGSIRPIR